MTDKETGEVFLSLCNALSCPVCVRAEAFRYGRAIGVASPTKAILLTGGAEDWKSNQRKLNRFRTLIRKVTSAYEDVAHIEPNPSGVGTHLHLFTRGDHLTLSVVQDCAVRAGFGAFSSVQSIRTGPGDAITYGVKIVIAGSSEGPDLPEDTWDFLALNGGRLGHATQNFWRDGQGRRVKGWRAAAKHFKRRRT